ncbi:putative stress response RCI peptide [Aspergillus novofumigatus IBT 16806]|uniref:Putative stress response RCI peptide n=1 Tax=Aspergillus novofumigatus (strain IBT 16806) TaxID=1392255 RepID=A0A2I1CIA6_ASPN1|nr:putative stress response RCI peptide [Aspergillus novofumigatus IBT 16806]PKX97340.1 putative stress response RCI peptide [Aspergillus novofumigatus IBT 16806]
MCGSDIFLGILAIFFPPVAVWIKVGICTADSIINLALCCLGYVPGLLHAWYIILKYPEPDYDDPNYEPIPGHADGRRDTESGRVTYYYVSHQPIQHPSQRGYGTVSPQNQPAPNPAPQPQQQAPKPHHEEGQGGSSDQAQGDSRPPPTYAEAVKGDHKVQTHD